MDAADLEEIDFFRALENSGARVLLIGRKAMIALGLPVATHDYDLWVHFDDIEKLNAAMAPFDHFPNRTPEDARKSGRYVLENGEHIDVMVARAATTKDGTTTLFDDVWARCEHLSLFDGVLVAVPSIPDLIRTKEWAMRAKDIADIQMLEALLRKKGEP